MDYQNCPYDHLFKKYAALYSLPWKLIRCQAFQESQFNPNAVSPCGAKGLMQLMPATDQAIDGHVDDFDPEGNVKDGVAYDREQFDHFKEIPDLCERLKFMLASYNGGRGYCLVGETPVILDDFTSKPIGQIKEGESILAFDESPIAAKSPRRFRRAVVTGKISRQAESLRLIFDDEQDMVCSTDHPWLKAGGWNGSRPVQNHLFGFLPAHQLRPGQFLMNVMPILSAPSSDYSLYIHGYLSGAWLGEGCFAAGRDGRRQSVTFSCQSPEFLSAVCGALDFFGFVYSLGRDEKITHLWIRSKSEGREKEKSRLINLVFADREEPDFLRGFLAGIYDAEGSCSRKQLSITQKNSTEFGKFVIDRACMALSKLGFSYGINSRSKRDTSDIRIWGTANMARFIVEVQPKIPHKRKAIFGTSIRGRKKIVAIEPSGKKEVFDISTTSGTFLPGGLASHNCNKALEIARWKELGNSDLVGARPGLWQTWIYTSQMLSLPLCVVNGQRPDHKQITDYVAKIWSVFIPDVFEMRG